jgi:hypothetical protein
VNSCPFIGTARYSFCSALGNFLRLDHPEDTTFEKVLLSEYQFIKESISPKVSNIWGKA